LLRTILLAGTLEKQGHLEEAERLGRDVLDISRRLLGDHHPRPAAAANSLVSWCCADRIRRWLENATPGCPF